MSTRNFLFASVSLISSVFASGAVFAADPASGYDWSGFYVGGTAALAEHRARYEDVDYDWFGATHDYNTNGFGFGVQAGRNCRKRIHLPL